MTLQDFKDKVARESAEQLKTDWKNWNDLSHAMWSVPAHLLALSDRAATLFAEHERKEVCIYVAKAFLRITEENAFDTACKVGEKVCEMGHLTMKDINE